MSVRLQPRLPSLSRRLRARLSVELLESRTVFGKLVLTP